MHNSDIPLHQVTVGAYLLLADDRLLEDRLSTYLFCEPVEVVAVHRGPNMNEVAFLRNGTMVVKASGFRRQPGREIGVEVIGESGGKVVVCYPDDRHLVGGVNLPDEPIRPA